MENIFILLTLLSFLGLIIGFINPDKSLFWKKENRTRKKSSIIYGLGMLASFILFGVLSDSKTNTPIIAGQKTETIAPINNEEIESNTNKEESDEKKLEQMLAILDQSENDKIKVDRIKVLLEKLADDYHEPKDTIAEYTSKSQGVLHDYGISESNLNLLEEFNRMNASKLDNTKFKDVITLYLMGRTGRGK